MANQNLFNSIKLNAPKRSHFDLTHDVKLTGNMGNLIPILNMECVPGDSFNISADTLIRFAPLISPVMHRMDATIHYFFVPNRILWKDFDDYISGKNESLVHPYVSGGMMSGSVKGEGSLIDYMGLSANDARWLNAFPLAAYQKIYNEYYRDQNMMTSVIGDDEILISGANTANATALGTIRKRCYTHDYFTSALPSTQFGSSVAVGMDANLNSIPLDIGNNETVPDVQEGAVTLDIREFRRYNKIQEFLELAMRSGRRFKETVLAYFGVDTGDARVNRPEYITGVKSPIIVSEVLNTAGVDGSNPQGAMAGHGVAVNVGDVNSQYNVKEHGWIIGILSVMPQPSYVNMLDKTLLHRSNRLEYYWPQFAHIGEQAILNCEIYPVAAGADVFGYVPRYSEYKYKSNRVAGNFKSSLDFWHLGRKFGSQPLLNSQFLEMDSSSVDRIFAVKPDGSTHSLYIQVLNKIQAVRPMPKFGTPML